MEKQTLHSLIFSAIRPLCDQLSQKGTVEVEVFQNLMLIVSKHS